MTIRLVSPAMNTLSRKQRDIRQREQLILDTASELLQSTGYLGLNMDRIAEIVEYSKGTIYQHFACKEELLCALCIRCLQTQHSMFTRAAAFNGRPRERISAILIAHQLFVKLYPREFSNLQIIKTTSIRDKVTPDSQARLSQTEDACFKCIGGIIGAGIQSGDLNLPEASIPELLFSLWSNAYGASMLQACDIPFSEKGIKDPDRIIRQHCRKALDGYGWQPLSTEWDYDKTQRRIEKELFAEEIASLATAKNDT